MKPKQIIILIVIFAILALGILWKSWVRSAGDNAGAARDGRVAFAEFAPEKLERILITRPAKTGESPAVELSKEDGVWKVKSLWNAKADPAKVENLIQKLHSVQGELRGSGKKLFADFGIEDAEAFSIKLFGVGNSSLLDLRLGTKQAGENAFFLRKAASEEVYLVDANMAELLGIYDALNEATPASLFWADLSLFNLDPEKVTKITVHRLKGQERTMITGLERKTDPKDPLKTFWKFLRKDMSLSPDLDKVLKFITVMNSVRAEKVVDPGGKEFVRLQPELKDGSVLANSEAEREPVWQLAVTEGAGKTLLNAGPKDEKGGLVYVKRSGDSTVFNLKTSFFDDLNVDDTHFVKDILPAVESRKDQLPSISDGLLEEQEQAAPHSSGGQATPHSSGGQVS